ncbi:hypothetical protein Tco_1434008, partial [Tanacetum coccineum]
FRQRLTAKGMGFRVADSHIGNHREDDFTPLETIRRFLEFVKNIGDYDDAPFERAEITFIDRNIANKAQNQKVKVSLKADGKRKQTGESFGKEPLQKVRKVSL